jgi:hypothetical protein
MNIFYLHVSAKICAMYHNDKHVVKMILELTQMLYTCLHLTCPDILTFSPEKPYRMTHKNHPSTIWVRSSIYNYKWLCKLGIELCNEYTYRYDKIHASQKHLSWLKKQTPPIPIIPFSPPPQAMPDKYKHPDTITAYRNYYIHEKASFSSWKKRKIPYWFSSYIE